MAIDCYNFYYTRRKLQPVPSMRPINVTMFNASTELNSWLATYY